MLIAVCFTVFCSHSFVPTLPVQHCVLCKCEMQDVIWCLLPRSDLWRHLCVMLWIIELIIEYEISLASFVPVKAVRVVWCVATGNRADHLQGQLPEPWPRTAKTSKTTCSECSKISLKFVLYLIVAYSEGYSGLDLSSIILSAWCSTCTLLSTDHSYIMSWSLPPCHDTQDSRFNMVYCQMHNNYSSSR